jgi:hypothetical protein
MSSEPFDAEKEVAATFKAVANLHLDLAAVAAEHGRDELAAAYRADALTLSQAGQPDHRA